MKNKMHFIQLAILISFVLLSSPLFTQTCQGTIYLRNQAQVDVFNCTKIDGNLEISGSDITDLSPLNSLDTITGFLRIQSNNNLSNLDGLSGLKYVGGKLSFSFNPNLDNLNGLSSLTHVSDGLLLNNNSNIIDLAGLSNLIEIEGDLIISSNQRLISLDGLSANITIVDRIVIGSNPLLNNVDGLSALTTVNGNLEILYNPKLTDLDGLSNLMYVGESIEIIENESLVNLDGLTNLIFTDGRIYIGKNSSLTDISGLFNLISIKNGLYITSNQSLSEINGFENLTTAGGLGFTKNLSLVNIAGFNSLATLEGDLFVAENESLEAIDGFCNLVNLEGDLELVKNYSLNEFKGFSSLNAMSGSISIRDNTNLPDINGLSALDIVNGSIRISNNSSIQNLSGLTNLDRAGRIFILFNNSLCNLEGFSSLDTVDNIVQLYKNASLKNLNGFESLAQIGDEFIIARNDSLKNLDGLKNLKVINGGITIEFNDALENIDGLVNLYKVDSNVIIKFNNRLGNVDGFSGLSDVQGLIFFSYNESLTWFCGLYPLFHTDGNTTGFGVIGNNNNPSKQQIIQNGPCSSYPRPVAHWPFNEGTGVSTEDITEHKYDGTLVSYPAWLPGKDGFSLSFDGINDHVEYKNGSDLDMGMNDFSFCTWVKMGINQNSYPTLLAKGGGASYDEGYWINIVNNRIQFYLSDGTVRLVRTSNTINIADENWHHIAIAADRDEDVEFFIDGEKIGSKDISSLADKDISSPKMLTVGSWQSSGNTHFKGSIDDLRIYNYLLSSEEIEYLASQESTVNHPPVMVAQITTSANPVVLPNGCDLKVEVVDPDGDELIYKWRQNFGFGNGIITFTPNNTNNSDITLATFSETGNYRIHLYSSDGEFSCNDFIDIVVVPASTIPNPVAHWTFDRGFGTVAEDVTDNNNFGILMNEPAWTEGVSAKAISFDGYDDRIDCGSSTDLDFGTNDFSILAWVNLGPDQNDYPTILAKGGGADYDEGYWINIVNNRIRLYLSDNNTRLVKVSDAVNIFDNQWHHLSIVIDRDQNVIFYLDGENIGARDISEMAESNILSAKTLTIGSWMTNTNTSLKGKIDDLRFYNETLTPEQINIIYALYDTQKKTPALKFLHFEGEIAVKVFPNPSSGDVNIEFETEEKLVVHVSVFNLYGELIKQILKSSLPSGKHSLKWDGYSDHGEKAVPGIYILKISDGIKNGQKKLIIKN